MNFYMIESRFNYNIFYYEKAPRTYSGTNVIVPIVQIQSTLKFTIEYFGPVSGLVQPNGGPQS